MEVPPQGRVAVLAGGMVWSLDASSGLKLLEEGPLSHSFEMKPAFLLKLFLTH